MSRVITLCGSTRFRAEFTEVARRLTLAGNIVLMPGVFAHDGDEITDDEKATLDQLHLEKIQMSDEVIIIAPGDYIGESTKNEIEYAEKQGVPIAYLNTLPRLPRPPLVTELARVLNRFSAEQPSGTPDFILAEYVHDCLAAFNKTARARAAWRGESTALHPAGEVTS